MGPSKHEEGEEEGRNRSRIEITATHTAQMFDTKDEHLEDENCVAEIARTLKRMEERRESGIEIVDMYFPAKPDFNFGTPTRYQYAILYDIL